MLIWDLVKSCLLAKRIGTATFLCIPIVNQFLNNSFVKRIGTAALLHFIPIFYHNIHFKACTCGIRGKLARAIFESSSSSSKISLSILYFGIMGSRSYLVRISFTSPLGQRFSRK